MGQSRFSTDRMTWTGIPWVLRGHDSHATGSAMNAHFSASSSQSMRRTFLSVFSADVGSSASGKIFVETRVERRHSS